MHRSRHAVDLFDVPMVTSVRGLVLAMTVVVAASVGMIELALRWLEGSDH